MAIVLMMAESVSVPRLGALNSMAIPILISIWQWIQLLLRDMFSGAMVCHGQKE